MTQYPEVEILPLTIPINIGDLGAITVQVIIADADQPSYCGCGDCDPEVTLDPVFTPTIVGVILQRNPDSLVAEWALYDSASGSWLHSGHLVDCVEWAYNHYQTKTN